MLNELQTNKNGEGSKKLIEKLLKNKEFCK